MKIIKKMMKILNWKCTFIIILLYYMNVVKCSEFPERECCDPIFPEPEPMPPALPTTTTLPSSPSTLTGRSGPNIKTAIAILNCILARQLCFEDPSCSAILEIIPRVCGPVPVSCSTVTVTKCQAALRTLQAFPFFRPTCLCKEPGIDPDCNYFRDFLFDHPCGFVLKKAEKDTHPIDALPTCNHALSLCQQDRKCIKLFEDFKTHCKVRDNRCRMEDRDACHEAWTNLRLSPMFGCICPNNHMKRRCDKIFSMVNHNPCIDDLSFSLDMSSDIETNSIYPNIDQNNETTVKTFPTYPHFLFPSSKQIPLALASHRPATTDYIHYISQNQYPPSYKSYHTDNDNDIIIKSTNYEHANSQNNNTMHWHNSNSYNNKYNNNNNYNAIKMNKSLYRNDNKAFSSPDGYDKDLMEIARSLGNSIIMLDETMTPIETPLLPSTNSYYANGESIENQIVFPYNFTTVQTSMNSGIIPTLNNYVIDASSGNNNGNDQSEYYIPPPPPPHEIDSNEIMPIPFQSTCHVALETCREDSTCSTHLHSVTSHCELYRCNRNTCMDALQKLFRNLYDDLSLDIAFCICRKTTTHHDKCMLAQEKLHPICAKRAPDNYHIHNGINYPHPPSCNSIVEICREDEYCSKKLEIFEQGCAFDSTTSKCAGKISSCRQAVVSILGTPLRTSCSCHGTEQQQHFDCLGWQKLLWLNPCVVEAQRDFHIKRLAELGILTTTTIIPTITAPNHRPPSSSFDFDTNYIDINPDSIPETLMQNGNEIDDGNENLNNENFSNNNKDDSIINNNNNNDLDEKILIHLTGNEGIGGGGVGGAGDDVAKNLGVGDNGNIMVDGGKLNQDIITEMEIKTTTVMPTTTASVTIMPTTLSTTHFTIRVPSGTTSQPIRFCVVQRPYQNDQYIPEGQSKRIKSDDAECSELCSCGDTGEPLSLACHALCVPMIPCRTPLAYYNHAAPAYQAYRGRCLCYSGHFICMRPPLGEYILPGGVYLLLGYSTADESMLRPHTNLGVQDAVRSLQHYLYTHITNRTSCTLTLFNMTDENVILSARLPHDIRGTSGQMLYKEKKYCQTILETISHHINSQFMEFTGHPLLSIFKMAEVQVIMPDKNSSNSLNNLNNKTIFFFFNYIIFLLLFIEWLFNYKLYFNLT